MNKFRQIWKYAGVKVAYIVTLALTVLLITASLVATQNSFLYETLKMALGQERLVSDTAGYYVSDYADERDPKAAAKAAASEFNEKVAEEGIVLLKNEEIGGKPALPLNDGAKVTVFGKNTARQVIGGSGSSASSATDLPTIYSSLTDAGFEVNPVMRSFYESSRSGGGRGENPSMSAATIPGFATGETPLGLYTETERNSYDDYGDAAIVMISRIGGEGFDLPRSMKTSFDGNVPVTGAGSPTDHYLELDANEKAMLREACNHFGNVVLILNTGSSTELGFLDTPEFYDAATGENYNFTNVKSALFIGLTGENGINGLGRILDGEVNPSGHIADTYARDFTADPSWANFGNNLEADGNRYTVGGTAQNAYFVEYEEGIYVGYRYYETRGFGDDDWYDAHVVFPFGHGLSYTDFGWTLVGVRDEAGHAVTSGDVTLTGGSKLTFTVRVHNDGDRAGKDVVQLYTTPQYYAGETEKSHVVLSDFAKTDLIAPGGDDEVEVTVDMFDVASYDYNNANGDEDGHKGYELDGGEYIFRLMKNAHKQVLSDFVGHLPSDVRYDVDPDTGAATKNRFDDVSGHITTYLSRNDWAGTFPTAPDASAREVTQSFIGSMRYDYGDTAADPWYTETAPVQSTVELSQDQTDVKFIDLVENTDGVLTVDYDDTALWDSLLNQLTVEQMIRFVGTGNYQTAAIVNINKPKSLDPDGPGGYTVFAEVSGTPSVYGTATYAGEMLLASTWNTALAEEMGVCVGNEGVIGNQRGDGVPYSGWYAPACNIHRSPFGGRNWEYYSEDGLFSGKFAAAVVRGAKTKGVYCYVKHFAVNEQEANRDTNGLITWLNEQSMREIYLRPFESAVKDGKTTAMMSSFNRIGTTWAGGSYALLTEILRNEWGFQGAVVTDYGVNKAYMNSDQMLRAGGDLKLNQASYPDHFESPTDVAVIRQATKNILYMTANSCLINIATGDIRYRNPVWVNVLIIVDCVVIALLFVWSALMTVLAVKKQKKVK